MHHPDFSRQAFLSKPRRFGHMFCWHTRLWRYNWDWSTDPENDFWLVKQHVRHRSWPFHLHLWGIRYKKRIVLAGLLYFHRISDNRMPGSLLKNFRRFEKLCGNDFNRIVLATTMWDEIDEDMGCVRERELERIYWKAIVDRGSSIRRFHQRDRNSAFGVIAPILIKANDKTPLLLQKEMTDRGLSLHQTAAGETLLTEPDDLLGHLQNVLEKIRNEMKQPSVDRKRILQLIEEHDYVSKQLQRSRGHTDRTWRDWFHRFVQSLDWNRLIGYGFVSVSSIIFIYARQHLQLISAQTWQDGQGDGTRGAQYREGRVAWKRRNDFVWVVTLQCDPVFLLPYRDL